MVLGSVLNPAPCTPSTAVGCATLRGTAGAGGLGESKLLQEDPDQTTGCLLGATRCRLQTV